MLKETLPFWSREGMAKTDGSSKDPTVIVFGLANFVVFAADTELQYDPKATDV